MKNTSKSKAERPNRVIAKVVGYEAARSEVASWVSRFNDANDAGRAVVSAGGLDAWDSEGSGEFCKAICTNLNTAKSLKSERYQIEVPW